ncbi:hypothetical protein HO133_009934 [Letharia lupina]|uniref:NAD(P)-binding protein n=1 Tax=Letharia lupina TaxID=560253 RepID=A0A8H6CK70_9LECA|nr:uncharacterized protein HO133_009934 [Letharia lupina]KAF6224741.1 hypothetical protein HO133_009934 [Letharia lupina]
MPSYVVTGASRGLGLQFVSTLSSDTQNVVIGLVRNKTAAEKAFGKAVPKNLSFLEADITDLDALKSAATETARLTGGGLDYLINNAALISNTSRYRTLGDFADDPQTLIKDLQVSFEINVIGVINTVNTFIPLLRRGREKKVFTLSTGVADVDFLNQLDIAVSAPYSISKGAVNVAVAKYNALYKSEGILFMAISPGLVDTGELVPSSDNAEDMKAFQDVVGKFAAYAPHFTGPITPQESVNLMLKLFETSSISNGNGGTFVSQFGNKQWL